MVFTLSFLAKSHCLEKVTPSLRKYDTKENLCLQNANRSRDLAKNKHHHDFSCLFFFSCFYYLNDILY